MRPTLRAVTLRAWLVAVAGLLLAGAGVTSLAAGSAVTSFTRMAIAAGVLAAYTAAVALIVTPRTHRTMLRCLVWGGAVPAAVAVVTVALVADQTSIGQGAAAGSVWLLGALPVCLAGRWLPDPPWRRRRP